MKQVVEQKIKRRIGSAMFRATVGHTRQITFSVTPDAREEIK
jgi:hypothetical protein